MTGPDVRKVQETLNTQGYRLPSTGFFGKQTDEAVRKFQTVKGLVPDGIVGYRTRRNLGLDRKPVHPSGSGHSPQPDRSSSHPAGHPSNPAGPSIDPLGAAANFLRNLSDFTRRLGCDVADLLESARKARARERTAPKPVPSRSPSQAPAGKPSQAPTQAPAQTPGDDVLQDVQKMQVLEKGLKFIFKHETLKGVSNRLHHPTFDSGVTLGPGYDMTYRKPPKIVRDLTGIGVDPTIAQKIAEASGYTSDDAHNFVRDNKKLVNLTKEQEWQLLIEVVPEYEAIVKQNVKVKLYQHQFDALVCYAYNTGPKFTRVYKMLNKGNIAEAAMALRKPNTSGGKLVKNLDDRRKDEIALFVYKNYGPRRG